MGSEKNYITPQGLEKLRQEYQELVQNERPKLVEVIAWAASNGDRSENADYIYGKRRLREIDRRLKYLTDRMDAAEIVNPKEINSPKVVFGATVTITNEDNQKFVYQIVGEDEIDVKSGKISWKSPVAKSLLGKKLGDEVLIIKPSGEEYITIEKIDYL